ncbi:unnamed protein product, partial [Prorocentrum cordatum]
QLERPELVVSDLQERIQADLERLERWDKSRAAVFDRVADLSGQLDDAKKEHQQGHGTLETILTMDDFLGTDAAKRDYDLEASDLDELNKRKDEIAKQVQAGLADIFKATLGKAKQ